MAAPLKISNESVAADLAKVRQIDLSRRYQVLGIQKQGDLYTLDFFNRQIDYRSGQFEDRSGEPLTLAVQSVLLKYILLCPDQLVKSDNRLVTFRELAGQSPLFSGFTGNIAKTIESAFSGTINTLEARSRELGAEPIALSGYDLSVRFRALTRVPIIVNFNDAEDGMPAQATFLYHKNADSYLDMTSLGILCTYLTGQMIQMD